MNIAFFLPDNMRQDLCRWYKCYWFQASYLFRGLNIQMGTGGKKKGCFLQDEVTFNSKSDHLTGHLLTFEGTKGISPFLEVRMSIDLRSRVRSKQESFSAQCSNQGNYACFKIQQDQHRSKTLLKLLNPCISSALQSTNWSFASKLGSFFCDV